MNLSVNLTLSLSLSLLLSLLLSLFLSLGKTASVSRDSAHRLPEAALSHRSRLLKHLGPESPPVSGESSPSDEMVSTLSSHLQAGTPRPYLEAVVLDPPLPQPPVVAASVGSAQSDSSRDRPAHQEAKATDGSSTHSCDG